MLSVQIQVLEDDESPIDGYSQGHISLEGEYETLSTKGSVMVFISLCQLLHHVRQFIVTNKTKAELPLGIDSWFEPILMRNGDFFSFAKSSGEIINQSSQEELTMAILTEAERVCDTYVHHFPPTDSSVEDLRNAIARFRTLFENQ